MARAYSFVNVYGHDIRRELFTCIHPVLFIPPCAQATYCTGCIYNAFSHPPTHVVARIAFFVLTINSCKSYFLRFSCTRKQQCIGTCVRFVSPSPQPCGSASIGHHC
ncbi:hypothetical protein BJV78DRAFT_96883 [Lactifluus subvellereus]|nr:hypothetical protein BJV78DRAFT_96883 [Lactifluus subvellereus]